MQLTFIFIKTKSCWNYSFIVFFGLFSLLKLIKSEIKIEIAVTAPKALEAFRMTHRKLAADKMAHPVSQCFGGAVVIDVMFPFLAAKIAFDLRLWI